MTDLHMIRGFGRPPAGTRPPGIAHHACSPGADGGGLLIYDSNIVPVGQEKQHVRSATSPLSSTTTLPDFHHPGRRLPEVASVPATRRKDEQKLRQSIEIFERNLLKDHGHQDGQPDLQNRAGCDNLAIQLLKLVAPQWKIMRRLLPAVWDMGRKRPCEPTELLASPGKHLNWREPIRPQVLAAGVQARAVAKSATDTEASGLE